MHSNQETTPKPNESIYQQSLIEAEHCGKIIEERLSGCHWWRPKLRGIWDFSKNEYRVRAEDQTPAQAFRAFLQESTDLTENKAQFMFRVRDALDKGQTKGWW